MHCAAKHAPRRWHEVPACACDERHRRTHYGLQPLGEQAAFRILRGKNWRCTSLLIPNCDKSASEREFSDGALCVEKYVNIL
jgi:hypothetical protein